MFVVLEWEWVYVVRMGVVFFVIKIGWPSYFHCQAVQPSTGQMVYDEFLDDPSTYGELGTRLSLLQPPEILLSQDASRGLGTMLNEWKRHR